MKSYAIALVMLIVLCGLAATGRAKIMGKEDGGGKDADRHANYALISPEEFQPIRADIVDDTPAKFTIDVKNLANISADDEAPVFAVYTESSLPGQCGDFRDLSLAYKKPSKYEREFDLSTHEDVLKAIDAYGCIVLRNMPSNG